MNIIIIILVNNNFGQDVSRSWTSFSVQGGDAATKLGCKTKYEKLILIKYKSEMSFFRHIFRKLTDYKSFCLKKEQRIVKRQTMEQGDSLTLTCVKRGRPQ